MFIYISRLLADTVDNIVMQYLRVYERIQILKFSDEHFFKSFYNGLHVAKVKPRKEQPTLRYKNF